jgi:hypothetical protein
VKDTPWRLSAGPRGSDGFKGETNERLMHPRRMGVNVGDNDPDLLADCHPVRFVYAQLPSDIVRWKWKPFQRKVRHASHDGDCADSSHTLALKEDVALRPLIQESSATRHHKIRAVHVLLLRRRRRDGERERSEQSRN